MNSAYHSNTYSNSNRGFTLLEVLISIAMLVFIGLAIYQSTTETYRLRDILSHEGEFYNSIRLAMAIMEKDVELIYSPKIMLPPAEDKSKTPTGPTYGQNPGPNAPDPEDQKAITEGEKYKGTTFWGSVIDRTGIRPSRFIGTETAMSFISASHMRVYKDSRESIFAKISYKLAENSLSEGELKDTKVLIKNINSNAFDQEKDDESSVRKYPLLEGIKYFKLRYYRKEKDVWEKAWDSENPEYNGQFPDLIEVELQVQGPLNMNFEGKYHFRLEIPFNGISSTT